MMNEYDGGRYERPNETPGAAPEQGTEHNAHHVVGHAHGGVQGAREAAPSGPGGPGGSAWQTGVAPARGADHSAPNRADHVYSNVQDAHITPASGYAPGAAGSGEPFSAPGKPGKKKRGRRALAALALVLACGAAGFGGGYAAQSLAGGGPTVVYKTPAVDNGSGSGAQNATQNGEGTAGVSDVAALAGQSVVSIVTDGLASDSAGSGVIISENGTILTNHHVVDGAQNIRVTLQDGTEYNAVLLGSDQRSDIAVIQIEAGGLVPAILGDSDALRVGDFVLAIGNPLGTLGGTVTDGIISALDRAINIDGIPMNLLQTNAAVSPGNSGGGLFNSRGELIGIVNAKSSESNAEGLAFAIPVNDAMAVAESLLEQGFVSGRAALGVSVRNASPLLGDDVAGVYVAEANAGGAGEVAGLLAGDIITAIDGADVPNATELTRVLGGKAVGDSVEVQVYRAGETLHLTVELEELRPRGIAG